MLEPEKINEIIGRRLRLLREESLSVGDEFRVQIDRAGDMDQVKVTIEPSPATAARLR